MKAEVKQMLDKYRHIHFIGIGGAGMSALAYVLVKRGFDVTGSDLQAGHMAYELAEAGSLVYMGQFRRRIRNCWRPVQRIFLFCIAVMC